MTVTTIHLGWSCQRCRAVGDVAVPADADTATLSHAIAAAHAVKQPRCDGSAIVHASSRVPGVAMPE